MSGELSASCSAGVCGSGGEEDSETEEQWTDTFPVCLEQSGAYMWAFRVAVAQYFFKDGAHMHYVGIHASSLRIYMNPTLNESFALQCFERSSVVELRD